LLVVNQDSEPAAFNRRFPPSALQRLKSRRHCDPRRRHRRSVLRRHGNLVSDPSVSRGQGLHPTRITWQPASVGKAACFSYCVRRTNDLPCKRLYLVSYYTL